APARDFGAARFACTGLHGRRLRRLVQDGIGGSAVVLQGRRQDGWRSQDDVSPAARRPPYSSTTRKPIAPFCPCPNPWFTKGNSPGMSATSSKIIPPPGGTAKV